ncbi:Dolichyl-phosphate-mannose--protein mannosyltransferase 1 [Thecaphora frezii]
MASLGQTSANVRSRQHLAHDASEAVHVAAPRTSSLYGSPPLGTHASSDLVRGKAGKLTGLAPGGSSGLGLGIGASPGSAGASRLVTKAEYRIIAALVVMALAVRLHKLGQPSSVVFDEVHFGGFAAKYIKGRFFMDVHPPLAKLLITFAAWIGGFNGNFDFKDIGREYLVGPDTPVPYVAMRALNALLGVATVPIAYLTLRSLSLRATTALLGALLVLFDNALTTQSRLILLDSVLVFFTALTVLFWVAFCNEEKRAPFSRRWWASLVLTGLSLGAVASSKWVGLFTIATVGVSVIVQLWEHLGDTRQPIRIVARHFVARALCLIGLPVLVYLFTFSIHLTLLHRSGEGDGFMSSAFQHTLHGHGMHDTYADVALGSTVTIRHLNTQGGYLHSHSSVYPTGSSQQQITLYPHRDENNEWYIVKAPGPEDAAPQVDENGHPIRPADELTRYHQEPIQYLKHGMEIRLIHRMTDKRLHSHDAHRPPVTESDYQNEVTGYGFEGFGGDANDNFHVEIYEGAKGDRASSSRVRALRTHFRLRHTLTGCYLFSHKVVLPEWGFGQQEVTCNKNPTMPNSLWYVETNTQPLLEEQGTDPDMVNYIRPSFLERFWELQKVMWETNAGLTERHAYDSRPQSWPFLRRGINFWTKDHRQIYLIGNPLVWWASSASVVAYLGLRALLMLRAKRGYRDLHDSKVAFYDQTAGFLTLGWALHFLPFFLMHRQLFLHHYLPALYFSILMAAVVFDFGTSTLRPRFRLVALGIVFVVVLGGFLKFTPITYASEWTLRGCEDARWVKAWDFNCRDFPDDVAKFKDFPPAIRSEAHHGSAAQASGTQAVSIGQAEAGRHAFENAPAQAMQSGGGGGSAGGLAKKLEELKHELVEEYHVVKDKVLGSNSSAGSVSIHGDNKAGSIKMQGYDQGQLEKVLLQGTAAVEEQQTATQVVKPATEPSQVAQVDPHAVQEAKEAADVVEQDRDVHRDD